MSIYIQKNWRKAAGIVCFLTLFCHAQLHASSFQSHSGITAAVKRFVKQQNLPLEKLQVRLTSLTNQVILPKCQKALEVTMPPGTKLIGNTNLVVSCHSSIEWKIHVAAHIDGEVSALVARYPIPRGSPLLEEHLDFNRFRYSQLKRGYYSSASLLENMEARRNIKPGQVLTPAVVKAQKLVLRGQHITIVAKTGSLNLRVKGKALMDGRKGQTIKVANLNSKKLLYAQVISAGVVRVNY